MSFSFTEPSTTHPTAEEGPVETKEVTTDAATTDAPADAGTAVQDDNAGAQPTEDTGGEASGQPSEKETMAERMVNLSQMIPRPTLRKCNTSSENTK